MFFYTPQQIADLNKSNYQSFVNLAGKYMNGLQELMDLNTQTIRTIIEECDNFPKEEVFDNAENLPSWQSSMLNQFPAKAASYNRHLHTIILSTGAEVAREVQRQCEIRGGQMNAILTEAIGNASTASIRMAETLENSGGNLAQESFDSPTKEAVENASSEGISQATRAAGDFQAASEAALTQPAKSSIKR